jgi:hypothetical protein
MAIDISKQYRTSSGLDVKELRIDSSKSMFPVRGTVLDPSDPAGEFECSWTLDGRYNAGGTDARDLIEAPGRVRKPKPRLLVSTDKKYRTIEGKEVRIYSTDNGGNYPVHGAWRDEIHNEWFIREWTAEGNQCITPRDTDPYNLVEVKPRVQREYWANIYPDTIPALHATRKRAEKCVMPGRIACVKVVIDCEEGEGLE